MAAGVVEKELKQKKPKGKPGKLGEVFGGQNGERAEQKI